MMRMKNARRPGHLLLAGIFLAACQDLPTAPPRSPGLPEPLVDRGLSGVPRDRFAIQCYVSRRVTGREYRYEYGVLPLRVPAPMHAPDGSTRLLQFRIEEPGSEPLIAGSCRIPNTPVAAAYVMKRLKLDRGRYERRGNGEEISVQGCVTDGTCLLDPVIVTVSRPTWNWDSWGRSGWGNDSSVWDYYEEYSGGDEWDPGPDGTYRPPCDRDALGNCINRPVNDAEWKKIEETIGRIKPNSAACAGAKAALQGLMDRGRGANRFKAWDGIDLDRSRENPQRLGENRYDEDGVYIEMDSFWLIEDPSVLVHEGLHTYYNSLPADNQGLIEMSSEQFAAAHEDTCW